MILELALSGRRVTTTDGETQEVDFYPDGACQAGNRAARPRAPRCRDGLAS
jgi:hypothetical protein